jgi:hypothetical protein
MGGGATFKENIAMFEVTPQVTPQFSRVSIKNLAEKRYKKTV